MKRSTGFITCLISAAFVASPFKIANSCSGPPDIDSYRIHMFLPQTDQVRKYDIFSYTTHYLNYSYSDKDNTGRETGYSLNVQEWKQELGGTVPDSAIYRVLYEVPGKEFMNSYATLKRNFFMTALLRPDRKAYWEYLVFSKQCESLVDSHNTWDEKPISKNEVAALLRQGESGYSSVSGAFLKLRYGFQLQKVARIAFRYQDCLNYYEKYVEPVTSASIVKTWALSAKAGALNGLGKMAEADYLFSRVFEQSVDKKVIAYESFGGRDLKSSLELAKDDHERGVLLAINELKNPGRALTGIHKLYETEPCSKLLELLLTREINKLEDWLLTEKITGFNSGSTDMLGYEQRDSLEKIPDWKKINYASDLKYLEKLSSFVRDVVKDELVSDPAFWNLSASYLAFLGNDLETSGSYLDKSGKLISSGSKLASQLHICRLFLTAAQNKRLDSKAEKTFFKELSWLKQNTGKDFFSSIRDQFLLYLALRYQEEGNIPRAALCRLSSNTLDNREKGYLYDGYFNFLNYWAKPSDIDALVVMLESSNKSGFEELLIRERQQYENTYHSFDRDHLLDLKATILFRDNRLDESLLTLEKVRPGLWSSEPYSSYLNSNPFYADPINSHIRSKMDTVKYTKTQIVEKMIALKSLADRGTDQAMNYFLLANAYYNITSYGNSWLMTSYCWSSGSYARLGKAYEENYYSCTTALAYYQKAMSLSTDREFQARCCLMLARCAKNKQDAIKESLEYTNRQDFKPAPNSYLQQFQDKYRTTSYYDAMIKECKGEEYYFALLSGAVKSGY